MILLDVYDECIQTFFVIKLLHFAFEKGSQICFPVFLCVQSVRHFPAYSYRK